MCITQAFAVFSSVRISDILKKYFFQNMKPHSPIYVNVLWIGVIKAALVRINSTNKQRKSSDDEALVYFGIVGSIDLCLHP